MVLSNNRYAIPPAPPTYGGVWFRDLDLDTEFFRTVCEVADTTLLHDGDVVLDASGSNDQVFGCPSEALIGRPLSELLRSTPPKAGSGEGSACRMRLALRADGACSPVRAQEVPVWCHGRSVKLLAIRAERRDGRVDSEGGIRSEWIASPAVVGDTDADRSVGASQPVLLGIAHDLNGMLTTVLTGLDLLERRGEDPWVHGHMVEACRRAASLVSELLVVGMGTAPERPLTNLEGAIRRGVSMAAHGTPVQVTVEIEEGLWPVFVNEGRFERVVHNLALNAVQAMPEGGALQVVARNAYVRQPSSAGVVAGRAVRVSVTDTGPGIPSSVLAKIFEPHFTTKRQGMGIGLAASRALVIEAGGDITVESMAGVGTTFHACVPAGVHTQPPPPPPPPPAPALPSSSQLSGPEHAH